MKLEEFKTNIFITILCGYIKKRLLLLNRIIPKLLIKIYVNE